MSPAEVARAFRARLGELAQRGGPGEKRVDRSFVMEGVSFERWWIPGPFGEIPAWFLAPSASPLARGDGAKLPLVIALHPHGRQFEVGKSLVAGLVGDGTRAYGLRAARAGFAVFCPDMLGFEDHRPPLAARKGNYALQGEGYERLLAMEALVSGETLQGRMLVELSTCVDTLARDERVDGARVAAMGQSYGGQEALFAMLFDERIRAGVVSCGFSLMRLLVERRISHNLALYVPGLLPSLDFDVLVPALAPRALTVIAGRRDPIFPVEGVEAIEVAARAAWGERGAREKLGFRYADGGHDLPAELVDESLAWLAAVLGQPPIPDPPPASGGKEVPA